MKYELVESSIKDIEILIEYKKKTIYEYEKNLTAEEIEKINSYINSKVRELINDYFIIMVYNKIVGCLLLTNKDDGILIDEIYLEEEYRSQNIGTSIIKDILNNNDIVYLRVHKDNKRAISLYKKLGFIIIDETDSRYYMKYCK